MLKSQSRVIGPVTITVSQLPVLQGFGLLARVAKILIPALSKLPSLDISELMRGDLKDIAPALVELVMNLDKPESMALELLSSARVQVGKDLIDLDSSEKLTLAFGANLGHLLKALAFALEVQFGDFFADAAAERRQAADRGEDSPATESSGGVESPVSAVK